MLTYLIVWSSSVLVEREIHGWNVLWLRVRADLTVLEGGDRHECSPQRDNVLEVFFKGFFGSCISGRGGVSE
jgi:hypothetical protein